MKTLDATATGVATMLFLCAAVYAVDDFPKPYSPPCTERENVFEFTEKPQCRDLGADKYEITFAVKGPCDATVGILDEKGVVVRHLGSGVLGSNAPAPFQKNSLKQTLYWNGKDDLDDYPKQPGKLRVQVRLGLKPVFDQLLLGKSPKNLSPWIWGIAAGPDGAYVFSKANGSQGRGSDGHLSCRRFDPDGGYVMSLVPAPANLPQEKLGGVGFVEYEPGVRASHGVPVVGAIHDRGNVFVTTDMNTVWLCQPFLLGRKLHFLGAAFGEEAKPYYLHRMNTDGSTDAQEISTPLGQMYGGLNCMAASPDGKWLYLVTYRGGIFPSVCTAVSRVPLTGGEPAKAFIGDPRAPGSDNQHFQHARGLDCDGLGRLYVCDYGNNRIQIFSAEGKHLKTMPVDRPELVRVHPKTGALYVIHQARLEGKSLSRLTKFTSFDAPVAEWHADNAGGQALAVDAWTARTRLWLGTGGNVQIYEEDGKQLNKTVDFNEDAKKEEGGNYIGQWGGGGTDEKVNKVVCDPVRERAYFKNSFVFDLKTGALLHETPSSGDDVAFDKRGYMHAHFNPGFYQAGVGRMDPDRATPRPSGWGRGLFGPLIAYKECPYDYGVEDKKGDWVGILPTKCQPGAKFFQDGVGVNMRGDVVVQSNIYHAPRMEEEGSAFAMAGFTTRRAAGDYCEESTAVHDRFVKDRERAGEEVYFIRRESGIPLIGGTIWTYGRNGELSQECAVNSGSLINGVQLDEDGCIYFVVKRNALRNGRPFLAGKGGTFGAPGDKRGANPLIGTLMKTSGKKTRFLLTHAAVPLDERPNRPPDLEEGVWVEGMEWLYAGASPLAFGCSCPTQRSHLDWYKRTFVPEAYRHSFGVLDAAGNVIMHLGTYGNYDSGFGPKSKIPVGGDNIALYMPRFISGTDNYLCFSDWGERLVVLKIAYHADETVPIKMK